MCIRDRSHCDLLIAIGARFSDRVTGDTSRFATRAQILQIEIDPAEINKNVIVDHSIIGDVKSVLQELNPRVDEKEHPAWLAEVEALKMCIRDRRGGAASGKRRRLLPPDTGTARQAALPLRRALAGRAQYLSGYQLCVFRASL